MNRQNYENLPFGSSPPSSDDGIELSTLIAGLRRSKWIILLCILLCGAAAFVVLKTIRPSYFSYAEVLLNTRQERIVGVEQVVSDLNVTNSVIAGEIAVLRSNVLLGRVVDDLGLMTHPDFEPTSDLKVPLLARLGFGATDPMPETEGSPETGLSERDKRNIVIWNVRRNLNAYQSGISYVINISMQAHDPEIAAAITNSVAEHYIQDQLNAKLVATQRAIDWLDNRLIDLETQLRDAEDAVVEFLALQVIEEGGDKESVELQLSEMNRMIVSSRNDRATAEARLEHIRSVMAQHGPEGAAATLETPRLGRLDDELATLEREQAQLATRFGARHPQMLELQLALDDLRRDRLDAIRAGLAELEGEVAQARGRELSIAAAIQEAQLLQVELSRSSVRLSQLERAASAMRQVYESFLARFQETAQQAEFQRADARIITRGEPALAAARPRNRLVMAVALVLGAILGLAAAMIREIKDPAPRTARELATLSRMSVLGVVPEVGLIGRRLRRDGVWQKRHLESRRPSRYVQRLVALHSAMRDSDWLTSKALLVTGVEDGVGATTTALGLARISARDGTKVAIVDANLRNPSVAKNLGVGSSVKDGAEVEPNLFLFQLKKAGDLKSRIQSLAKDHDHIIIDGPIAIDATITRQMASQVHAVLMIARSHRSRSHIVATAANTLLNSNARLVGAVLSHSAAESDVSVHYNAASSPTLATLHSLKE